MANIKGKIMKVTFGDTVIYDANKKKEQLEDGEIMNEKEASKQFDKNAGKIENNDLDEDYSKYHNSVLNILAPYLYIINKFHNL